MAEQRERSRSSAAFEGEIRVSGPPTEFVGFETTEVLTAILALEDLGDGTFQAKLERSPFYPEGGGQVSDGGWIESEVTGDRAELVRATRVGDDQVLTLRGDGFAVGDRVKASVPWSVRFPTMANHTATHLLHKALRDTLGEHVVQAGSAVRPDKLRFDFKHDKALTTEEREQVERAVNEKVFQNLPVRTFVTPIEEARKLGAMMLFGEKYGDEVRVVEVDGYSRELCGGTHVRSTAEIGPFVILSEGSVGSGVRRIEAITAGEAWAALRARSEELDETRAELERVRKELAKGPKGKAGSEVVIRDESNGIVVAEVEAVKGSALKDLSDQLRQSKKADAVLLGSVDDGRAYLVVNLDQSLVEKGLDAVQVARKAAEKIGGGGGGRPTLAEAGGKDPEGLAEAYEVAKERDRGHHCVKVLALDYGSARTGVAVSDPTGTLARPLGSVEQASTEDGMKRLVDLVRAESPERVVVGLPLTLRGERGAQAEETERFVESLMRELDVPVETFDERFTTALAGPGGDDDARAAAHLLTSYLEWWKNRQP